MKRPLAVIGLTYAVVQTVAVLCGAVITVVLFCIAVLCAFVVFVFIKKPSRPPWLAAVVLSACLCLGVNTAYNAYVSPINGLQGKEMYISGRVVEAPYENYGRYCYIVEAENVYCAGKIRDIKLRLSSSQSLEARYNDRISAKVIFNTYSDDDTYNRSLMADNVLLTAHLPYGSAVTVQSGESSFYGKVIDMRAAVSNTAHKLLGNELAPLLDAMLAGDTSGISTKNAADFRDCGLSHLFAVSGLHLSLLVGAVTAILRRLKLNYRIVALLNIPFVLFFMAFAGFSMSVRRAGVMTLLMLTATVCKREADPLNSLGASVGLICLLNPYAAADAGLLMSASSTLGIILLSGKADGFVRKKLKLKKGTLTRKIALETISSAATAVIAGAFTFPVTALVFGEISLLAPIANVLCLTPAMMFMLTGAVSAVLFCIPFLGWFLGALLAVPCWIAGRLALVFVRGLAALPGAGVAVNYPFLMPFFVICAVMLAFVLLTVRGKAHRRKILLLCLALLVQIFICGQGTYKAVLINDSRVTAYSVGDGVIVSLESGGRCVLIGAGGDRYDAWQTCCKLKDKGLTDADALFLPEQNDNYSSYAAQIIELFEPSAVFTAIYGENYERTVLAASEHDCQVYGAGNARYSAEGCEIEVISHKDGDGNIWIYAENNGLSVLVCPTQGDCAQALEVFEYPDIAVVQSGDMTNAGMLYDALVIVSTEQEQAAHAQFVLNYRGVENVRTTAYNGDVTVTAHEGGVRVYTEK